MAYQMAATPVTLNGLEGYPQVAGLFKFNPSNICAAFTPFQLALCLRVPLVGTYVTFSDGANLVLDLDAMKNQISLF